MALGLLEVGVDGIEGALSIESLFVAFFWFPPCCGDFGKESKIDIHGLEGFGIGAAGDMGEQCAVGCFERGRDEVLTEVFFSGHASGDESDGG